MARVVSQGVRARRRGRRLRMVAIIAVLTLVVCGALVWLFYASFTRIATIAVSGVASVSQVQVESLVREKLDGSYLLVAPKDSIFFYPKSAIATDLRTQFPTFKSVRVRAKDFTTIGVAVVEREPYALWCGANATSTTGCLLMDTGGVAYAPAAEFTGDTYVRYHGTVVPLVSDAALPKQYLTEEQFGALAAFVDAMRRDIPENPVRQVAVDESSDARAYFQKDFLLIFSLGDSSADVYERFALALEAEPFIEHALEEFEYLDLRFGDELYYKFKE